ncbi:MAG: NADH-quinone oxidoreductase subunit J [Candidatus Hydrothermarchaeota archaeon]|nr:MAG: NADH-quinone oxidoreductase subunit J [Candidatus Hydrothermarchaeota archaeon]
MSLDVIAFAVTSAIMLLAAIGVIKFKEIVRAALMLFFVFTLVGVLFLFMEAEFLAIIQVLVYAGAVVILVLFAIMLTRREGAVGYLGERVGVLKPVTVLALISALFYFVFRIGWFAPKGELHGTTKFLGQELFTKYILQFELLAILLLAAMIASIYLVRREVR